MGIIHLPDTPEPPQRPAASAEDYPYDAIWESPDGSQWMVVWDNQDKRKMWELIKTKPKTP